MKHSIAKVFCPVGESCPKQEVVEICWYIILKALYMSVYVMIEINPQKACACTKSTGGKRQLTRLGLVS